MGLNSFIYSDVRTYIFHFIFIKIHLLLVVTPYKTNNYQLNDTVRNKEGIKFKRFMVILITYETND